MEVAGLILAAVPLTVAALQCYRTGKDLSSIILNRKRHIQQLVRALQWHDTLLEINLILLLKTVEVYKNHTPDAIPYLIQDLETVRRIEDFLGIKGLEAFKNALLEATDVVQTIAKSIRDFVPSELVSLAAYD